MDRDPRRPHPPGPPHPDPPRPDPPRPGPARRMAARGRLPAAVVVPITIVLVPAVVLRALAMIAYRPALEFSGDSMAYLRLARPLVPDPVRPAGYPLLLRALSVTHRLWVVPAVQHLMGVLLGILLYALLVHRGVTARVAALAAAPVLLDAYQVNIEHFVMAETLFEALLVVAVAALLWAPRPSVTACVLAGGCLALASLVRTVGVVLGVLALAWVLLRRLGWSRSVVFGGALAAPLVGYAVWFHSAHGAYALTGGDTYWLYGRVAPIADCARLDLSPDARLFCSPHPPAQRPGPNYYVWNHNSPRFTVDLPEARKKAALAEFARQVIRRQPADYARMVTGEVAHFLTPGRWVGARDWYVGSWQFPDETTPAYWNISAPLITFDGTRADRRVGPEPAALLRAYQRYGFTPGPALAVMVALGAAGFLPAGRRAGPERAGGTSPGGTSLGGTSLGGGTGAGSGATTDSNITTDRSATADRGVGTGGDAGTGGGAGRLRADCALLVAAEMALLVVPSATVCFDYRYLLPTLVLLPPAAALGWLRISHAQPRRRPGLPRRRHRRRHRGPAHSSR
ncbi:hypothetical protein, partial [Frankia sp. CiP1_Cm_nod1]|uniref:hypothetical protein n=1 Tax=Frankia sp. CiP1_Cm_nod1 TaxID=2897160 RepID=UPI002024AF1A